MIQLNPLYMCFCYVSLISLGKQQRKVIVQTKHALYDYFFP